MIEIGEFVRINNDFRLIALGIGKVIGINKDTIYVKMKFELSFSFKIENIANHSKNIIDLIEVGDYVNGRKIERVNDYGEHKRADFNLDFDDCDAVYNEDIKSILTKEQYQANAYKIGD